MIVFFSLENLFGAGYFSAPSLESLFRQIFQWHQSRKPSSSRYPCVSGLENIFGVVCFLHSRSTKPVLCWMFQCLEKASCSRKPSCHWSRKSNLPPNSLEILLCARRFSVFALEIRLSFSPENLFCWIFLYCCAGHSCVLSFKNLFCWIFMSVQLLPGVTEQYRVEKVDRREPTCHDLCRDHSGRQPGDLIPFLNVGCLSDAMAVNGS